MFQIKYANEGFLHWKIDNIFFRISEKVYNKVLFTSVNNIFSLKKIC